MTTGFGFCPNCGAPRMAAEQRFCAGCGLTLSPVEPMAPVEPMVSPAPPAAPQSVAPGAWSVPPAPPAAAQPVAPPAWSAVPPDAAAPAYTGGPSYQNPPITPSAPAVASAGIRVTPQILAIGGLVLAVVVGAYLFMNMNSNSGGITFSPSTLSCSSPVAFTTSAHLPSSVKAGDNVTITLDGKSVTSSQVSSVSDMVLQPDGSWTSTSTTSPSSMQAMCAAGGSAAGFNILTPGTHTMQVLDSSGKILAQGSYTVTP